MSAQATAVGHPEPSVSGRKTRKRILTGDRPTAKSFHIGNYYGTLANRVKLQDEYESFFLIADYHMLTTRVADLQEIGPNIRELVTDYLAVGIDPKKTTIYLQSLIPEVTELFLYFAMLVSVPRAQRIPTLKDQMRDHNLAVPSYGLLGYPVLQAADILMVKETSSQSAAIRNPTSSSRAKSRDASTSSSGRSSRCRRHLSPKADCCRAPTGPARWGRASVTQSS